jgi:hypothetical protein
MKKTVFIVGGMVFFALPLAAQPVSITRTDIRGVSEGFQRTEFQAIHVEPVTTTDFTSTQRPEVLPERTQFKDTMDFGGQSFESRNQNHENNFSNMRMEFHDPEFKHLDFNAN